MKNILKSNVKLFYGIAVLSALVLSLSYGVFVIQSNQYNASELLVGNLLYGITVHDTDKQELSNPVTVPTGETTLYITIASVNSITSKYTLAYNNNNVSVSASNKSGWNASGSMSNFQDYAYTKTVKVVVTNNSGSNQTVTFAAFGGYSYNSAANIPLGNGYYTVANFTDVTQVSGELLTDIVEEDTNCLSSNCLYGGEATTNYFSFEENGDLYRIIGTYTLNNEKTTKIAANDLVQTTIPSNLNTTLSTIANTLETDYIYNTNLFNCQGTTSLTCTSYSNFNSNIGIISLDEYKQLEGDNENNYLYNSNSYYLLNNNTLVTNTNQTETPTSAYIRPTMYLTSETQVEGSGTLSDPYILEEEADINIIAYTLNGQETNLSYNTLNSAPYDLKSVTCSSGNAEIKESTDGYKTIYFSEVPAKCFLDFGYKTYTVTGATNSSSYGTVTSSTIDYGGTTTLTITPSSGNYLSTFSCTNGYTYSGVNTGSSYTSAQTATISNNNQASDSTCTATFKSSTCTVTLSGANYWRAKYNCTNGSGTMTECWYHGITESGTKCNGGTNGPSYWSFMCTSDTRYSWAGYLYYYCNTSLSNKMEVSGGRLDESISCSCD